MARVLSRVRRTLPNNSSAKSFRVSLQAADESFVYDGLIEYPRQAVEHQARDMLSARLEHD
jgi:hypothetical protein